MNYSPSPRTGRRMLAAALVALVSTALLPSADAQRLYTLDPVPNNTFRGWEWVSFQKVAATVSGQMYVLGGFQYVDGIASPELVRLEPDGRLDPTFTSAYKGAATFAIASDGGLYVAGTLTAGSREATLAKLSASGTVDPSFAPVDLGPTIVRDVITLPDGGFYVIDSPSGTMRVRRFAANGQPVAGYSTITLPWFTTVWAVGPAEQIVLVHSSLSGPASTFEFDANGLAVPGATAAIPSWFQVGGAVFDPNGALVLSGGSRLGTGQTLLRLLPGGTIDSGFSGTTPLARAYGTQLIRLSNGSYATLALVSAGGIDSVLQFSADGTFERILTASGVGSSAPISLSLHGLPDGDFLLTGIFTAIGEVQINQAARLTAEGDVDPTFHTDLMAPGRVSALSPGSDGGVMVGGRFDSVSGTPAGSLAQLRTDGTLDTTYPWIFFGVNALTTTADGGVLAFGSFAPFAGTGTTGLVKVAADHSVDTSFLAGLTMFGFHAGLTLPDGSVLLGGRFGTYGGTPPAPALMRVTPSGVVDSTFNNHLTLSGGLTTISALGVQPGGGIIVAGSFSTVDGAARPGLARTSADGELDPTFAPTVAYQPSHFPVDVSVLPDGRFYVLATPTGATFQELLRYNPDGAIDGSFAPALNGNPTAYALAADGSLFVGISGSSSGAPFRLLHVLPDGSLDPTFDFDFDAPLEGVFIDPQGRLVVGGWFTTVNGTPREALARIDPVPLGVKIDGDSAIQAQLLGTIALVADVTSAAGPVSFQWYHNGVAITRATTATLAIGHLVPKDSGEYSVAVAAAGETATSAAVNVTVVPGLPAVVPPGDGPTK